MISTALAAHGVTGTGSSSGGTALLIILGTIIALAIAYVGQKRWRARKR